MIFKIKTIKFKIKILNTVELTIRILLLIIIFSTTLWLLFKYSNKKAEKKDDEFEEFMKKVVTDMEVLFNDKPSMSILRGLKLKAGHINTSLYPTPALIKFESEVIIQAWEQFSAKVVFDYVRPHHRMKEVF